MSKAGKALVRRIVDDMAANNLEPTAKEHELLSVAEGLADQLAGLRGSLAARGYSSVLESGRIVLNPAVVQINSTSLALAKVLSQIQMGEDPPINRVKQRAALTRWRAHNEAKSRWAAGGGA
jgi:hypothetical protein